MHGLSRQTYIENIKIIKLPLKQCLFGIMQSLVLVMRSKNTMYLTRNSSAVLLWI